MSYTVLARRYRSQAFADVIGQEPVAKTLRNAIATGRVAHAYLFTGTRGVGKTSMARLFARALNAPATVSDCPKPGTESPEHAAAEQNPAGEATGIRPNYQYPDEDVQQRMAEAIMRGDDLNVIEIDGASHNKVEDARDLISNAGLSPTTHARFKIYIIDEVHMLSTAAFNALLKTMEEPPPHVKFILATTEPQKVPPTIQSRCQRFDFRNIPSGRIAEHLRAVLEKEGVEADDEVVFQLAALGNGSMRDALSLLDRLIATGDRPLTPKTLEEMFGLPDAELIHRLIAAFADGDVPAALNQAGDLLARGISQDQLVEVLIDHLRTLMLLSACGSDTPLVEIAPQGREKAAELAGRFDTPAIVHMIALCENLQRSARASANGRALLDATLARLCLTENIADVAALLAGNASPAPQKKK
jgi:DNA polymerase III subunit gamma/tau